MIVHRASSRVLVTDGSGNLSTKQIKDVNGSGSDKDTSLWKIEPINKKGKVSLYTISSAALEKYYLSTAAEGGEQTMPACVKISNVGDMENDHQRHFVEIQNLSGELCFFSSPLYEKRISCSHEGYLSMSSNWKGWEVFRIAEVGDGVHVRISSWTHDTKVLHSDIDGKVVTKEETGAFSKWVIELAPENLDGVVIKSALLGRYLHYDDANKSFTMRDYIDHSCVWDISSAHAQKYLLSSIYHDKRMGCDNAKGRVFCTSNRKESEVWQLKAEGNGFVSIQSSVKGGKYLSCDSEGALRVVDSGVTELWMVQQSNEGGISVLSKEHGWYLACDGKSIYCSKSKDGSGRLSWSIVPYMPPTITKRQMVGYAKCGTVVLASIIAMPSAVMGAIGAMGYTSTGISSGSIAAWMMSAEAIASGGGVLAGGTVATLQSIGAAGLGIGGTIASMCAGGVVGVVAIGLPTLAPKNCNSTKEGGKQVTGLNRPFCNWRAWI